MGYYMPWRIQVLWEVCSKEKHSMEAELSNSCGVGYVGIANQWDKTRVGAVFYVQCSESEGGIGSLTYLRVPCKVSAHGSRDDRLEFLSISEKILAVLDQRPPRLSTPALSRCQL
jgi:hypothetical protein